MHSAVLCEYANVQISLDIEHLNTRLYPASSLVQNLPKVRLNPCVNKENHCLRVYSKWVGVCVDDVSRSVGTLDSLCCLYVACTPSQTCRIYKRSSSHHCTLWN